MKILCLWKLPLNLSEQNTNIYQIKMFYFCWGLEGKQNDVQRGGNVYLKLINFVLLCLFNTFDT